MTYIPGWFSSSTNDLLTDKPGENLNDNDDLLVALNLATELASIVVSAVISRAPFLINQLMDNMFDKNGRPIIVSPLGFKKK